MANAFYDDFLEGILEKKHDIGSGGDTVAAALIDGADYTYSADHVVYGSGTPDVPAGAKVATQDLATPTVTDGTYDTADFTWASVTGDESENIILYNNTLTNDDLIAFYDTGMTGMPVTPSGGNIDVTVNGSGWFSL